MLARVRAASIVGLDAFPVEVETDLRPSLSRFVIVGLPDASLKESQERVESAIKNSDLEWPMVVTARGLSWRIVCSPFARRPWAQVMDPTP